MTLTEYVKKISDKIQQSPYSYNEIISEAERVLDKSNITERGKKQFWIDLYNSLKDFFKLHQSYSFESQGSDELSKAVAMAKSIIAKKAS
ncbi:hypothetical protein [Serratia marcescens]|uniref:hypothetical protein n=1 Tax=Enterobacterales TaxID=91347 RepID=UPI001B9648ED|nr:hypothetical protein [Serratia marcescens]